MPNLLSTIILIMQLLKIADISNERERTKRCDSLGSTSLEIWSTIRSIASQKREKRVCACTLVRKCFGFQPISSSPLRTHYY